jgi:hypothetical protein
MSKENTTGKGPGAPLGNTNAFKHGKYSKRRDLILTCRTCAGKSHCDKYDSSNPNVACAFEKLDRIDLTDIGKLTDFLRNLIEIDYLRYRRGCNFEIFSGGMLDGDLIKLGQHIQRGIYTLGQLLQVSELERRVAALEAKIENRREGLK